MQTEEKPMSQEELQAFWQQKVAEAKRYLKLCSKNELIRTVIQLQIRNYELEVQMENLTKEEESSETTTDTTANAE